MTSCDRCKWSREDNPNMGVPSSVAGPFPCKPGNVYCCWHGRETAEVCRDWTSPHDPRPTLAILRRRWNLAMARKLKGRSIEDPEVKEFFGL